MRDLVLIIDADHPTARIAAKKLRAERICCHLMPWDGTDDLIGPEEPAGILLCAAADTPVPALPAELQAYRGPVLALGAAAATLCQSLGGSTGTYSAINAMTLVHYCECPLLNGLEPSPRLIRGLTAMRLPDGAQPIATIGSENTALGFSLSAERRFGLQLELEAHDPDSTRLLTNFALNICGCTAWWDDEAFIRETTDEIRRAAGDGNALCLMTGGLYSSVTALLAAKALGDRVTSVFVHTGLLQDDQEQRFFSLFQERTGLTIITEDHEARFLQALRGIRGRTDKQRTIESMLTMIRRDLQRSVPHLNAVIRGRSYVDRINEGEEIAGIRAGVLCVEPLRDLFMEEVRQIARRLGMPEELIQNQSIPNTGLALDIDGEVTAERLDLLRSADRIFRRLIEQSNQARRLSAYYASLSAVGSVYTVTLHALAASDLGLSRAARIPYDILESVTEQIRQELPRIRHVTYDLTPHMTI